MKKLKAFVEELAATEVTPGVCNQYSYEHAANAIRRGNLYIYLQQMQEINPEIMLVGEAPGYRGCRLTGVPFTSEHLLMNNMKGLNMFGKQNGYRLAAEKEKLMKETTATIIWETLIQLDIMVLSWNAFPFHPHRQDNELSNRTPLRKELLIGQTLSSKYLSCSLLVWWLPWATRQQKASTGWVFSTRKSNIRLRAAGMVLFEGWRN